MAKRFKAARIFSVVDAIEEDTDGSAEGEGGGVIIDITIGTQGPQGPKGDKGDKGDPIAIHNGLDSDATDEALAAYQGKVLDNKVSQLSQETVDAPGTKIKNLNYKSLQLGSISWAGAETTSTNRVRTDFIDVVPGSTYVIYSNHGLSNETQYVFEYAADGTYIKNSV